jgi:GNAT superfamily N-acetyltransferase
MNARSYTPDDREICLQLFRTNVPNYFGAHEEADYVEFLDDLFGEYFVFEEEQQTVACGGIYVDEEERWVGIIWTIVDGRQLRKGIGRRMFDFLIGRIKGPQRAYPVYLDTSQHSLPFWEKMGFRVYEQEPDGYGPGLDRYDMRLESSANMTGELPKRHAGREKKSHAGSD